MKRFNGNPNEPGKLPRTWLETEHQARTVKPAVLS
jgi:hypothetical protein